MPGTSPARARRVRQRLRAVLEWAVAKEYRIDNPYDRIGPLLGPQHDVTEHIRALPHREDELARRRTPDALIFASGNCAALSCGDLVVGEESVEQSEALLRLLELQEVGGVGHKGVFDAERLAE